MMLGAININLAYSNLNNKNVSPLGADVWLEPVRGSVMDCTVPANQIKNTLLQITCGSIEEELVLNRNNNNSNYRTIWPESSHPASSY